MRRDLLGLAAVISIIAGSSSAQAQVQLGGTFIARAACPALQSIRKTTNPGDVMTTVDRAYPLIGKNKAEATYYRIRIEDAPAPKERWVSVDCGVQAIVTRDLQPPVVAGEPAPASSAATGTGTTGPQPNQTATNAPMAPAGTGRNERADTGEPGRPGAAQSYVFAVSWEPAFCETHTRKPECRSETPGGFDATHFSLHGLWPQSNPRFYCGVPSDLVRLDKAGDWHALPPVQLTEETRARLAEAMPGTRSDLERHEWIEHGTCSGMTAEVYFERAIGLLDALNASKVRAVVAGAVGQTVPITDIQSAVASAFGAGAGDRVHLTCVSAGNGFLLDELELNLSGDVAGHAPIADLLAHARRAPLTGRNAPCPETVTIDSVGRQ